MASASVLVLLLVAMVTMALTVVVVGMTAMVRPALPATVVVPAATVATLLATTGSPVPSYELPALGPLTLALHGPEPSDLLWR